jgi:hypothetical protein
LTRAGGLARLPFVLVGRGTLPLAGFLASVTVSMLMIMRFRFRWIALALGIAAACRAGKEIA